MNRRTQMLAVIVILIQSCSIVVLEWRLHQKFSARPPAPIVQGANGTVCEKVADHTWDCRRVTVGG